MTSLFTNEDGSLDLYEVNNWLSEHSSLRIAIHSFLTAKIASENPHAFSILVGSLCLGGSHRGWRRGCEPWLAVEEAFNKILDESSNPGPTFIDLSWWLITMEGADDIFDWHKPDIFHRVTASDSGKLMFDYLEKYYQDTRYVKPGPSFSLDVPVGNPNLN